MHSILFSGLSLLALNVAGVAALALPATTFPALQRRAAPRPFNQVVAFGDELSDNGNGSWAHNITPDPYGYKTWTSGPVAVTFLAYLYGVGLNGYSFGAANGGADFGATIDNDYTQAVAQYNGAPVPSVRQQIRDHYTSDPDFSGIRNHLHVIWVGNNDVSKHTDAFWLDDPVNAAFGDAIGSKIVAEAEYLAERGAQWIVVANIYPKHLAPVTRTYLCKTDQCVNDWGAVIKAANDKLRIALAASKYSKQFIYYDAFKFITDSYNDRKRLGYTDDRICDGLGDDQAWKDCIAGDRIWDGAKTHFWFTFVQPETSVHLLIARDMKRVVDAALGL